MTPDEIRRRYGTIFPAFEWEIDAEHKRTGRKRTRQHVSYPRPWDPKPMVVWAFA